jgi:hypothetical protein
MMKAHYHTLSFSAITTFTVAVFSGQGFIGTRQSPRGVLLLYEASLTYVLRRCVTYVVRIFRNLCPGMIHCDHAICNPGSGTGLCIGT